MLVKLLTYLVNLGLAAVLVLICVSKPVIAQDVDAQESIRLSVPLRGTGIIVRVGALNVSPTVFDAGQVTIGKTVTNTITLVNAGDAQAEAVTINEATLFGINKDEFSIDFAGYVTLQPGETREIQFSATPTSVGPKNAGLRLAIEGASSPHLIMARAEAALPLTSNLLSNKASMDFGEVLTSNTATQVFELSNSSTDPNAPVVNIQSVTLSGQKVDAFTHDFTEAVLMPGDSTQVSVTMQSAQAGYKSAQITVEHDGVNQALNIDIEGEVVEPTLPCSLVPMENCMCPRWMGKF